MRGSNSLFNLFQRLLDLMILIAVTLGLGENLVPRELGKVLVIYCGLLLVFIFSFLQVYHPWRKTGLLRQLLQLAFAWGTVLLLFNLIILLLSTREQLALFSPLVLFESAGFNAWAAVVFCGLAAVRVLIYIALRIARSRGYHQQSAVIIGAGVAGKKLAHYVSINPWMGIKVAAFFDDAMPAGTQIREDGRLLGVVAGAIHDSFEFAAKNQIELVFLALPIQNQQIIGRIIGEMGTKGHTVLMVQDLFTFGIQKAKIEHLGGLQLLDFYLFPMWKRMFDLIFSTLMLICTFPLWLLIMAAIKLEDRGPIFFRHPRVMENGKRFDCLKFRTMHADAQQRLESILDQDPQRKKEWEGNFKLKNDPRVTATGRILRRFSLDELPQFINVLTGEMSVVGARPVVSEELKKYYREATLTYCAMKPGITGPWQVGGRNGMDYETRVELDRWYILNCTFWMDLRIIAKTLWQIAGAKENY